MTPCRRIRPWIVRSVDGDLEPGEAFRLARHLATCTACRILLARESRLAQMLDGAADAINVDESFFGAVMAALPDLLVRPAIELTRKTRRNRGLRLAAWGALAALGGGLAARVLPYLRLDVAAPAMPQRTFRKRFSSRSSCRSMPSIPVTDSPPGSTVSPRIGRSITCVAGSRGRSRSASLLPPTRPPPPR